MFKKRFAHVNCFGRNLRGIQKGHFSRQWFDWLHKVKNFMCKRDNNNNISPVLVEQFSDNRPYIEISLFDEPIIALLDSGANKSVIGKNGLYLLDRFNLTMSSSTLLSLNTADNTKQPVIGQIRVPIVVNAICKVMTFLIVPSIQSEIILGSDFCNVFSISLNFRNKSWDAHVNVINDRPVNNNERLKLNAEQKVIANELIDSFTSLGGSKN